MLSVDNISMQFGGRLLFNGVSFMIGPHDRIGLVGSNGAGKSTLLKIISGTISPEKGSVNKARFVSAGYLPQDGVASAGMTLYGEVETAFDDILLLQKELEEAHVRMSVLNPASNEYAETLEVFGELQHKLEDLDAFRMKSKIERVLMGLGFNVGDMNRRTEEFSGGWQMRIELAKLLLKEPSILLLDEPTNHLDLDTLQWLDAYLQSYNGAVVLVSHDRAFLDSLTTKTFALNLSKLEIYAGNYSFYEKERLVRHALAENAYKNQQQQIKQTQEFIERFRYKATKARQVQSRIKQLEKMELIEIEHDDEEIHFHFPPPVQSGKVVMELKNMRKNYDSHVVFDKLNFAVERGDRIAVVGVNGAGKSTFSRLLAGTEQFQSGERTVGHNVTVSYFAQHQAEELDMTKDALAIVDEVAVGDIRTKLRTILGSFLFHGDDVFKKVSVLSGGEKSRLALAKMLLQPSNFLILDEPTNHLDMRSKKVLQEALKEFEGTYLIVSHDRAFLDPIVNKVVEVSKNTVRIYPGTVTEYLLKKREEAFTPPIAAQAVRPAEAVKQALPEKERKRLEAEQRQLLYKKLRPIKEKLIRCEKEIEMLEDRRKQIDTMMQSPEFYQAGENTKRIIAEWKETTSMLERLYAEWEKLTEEIGVIQTSDLTTTKI